MKSSTITVRLPTPLRGQLEKLSKSESRPTSDLIRESIREYLALRRFRDLRRKVLPFAEAEGLLTDDDIFAAMKR